MKDVFKRLLIVLLASIGVFSVFFILYFAYTLISISVVGLPVPGR